MPRDGSSIYHTPVGTDAVSDTTIESTKYNINVHDIETDLNAPRPIVAGGTGAATAPAALANLGGLPLTGGTMTGPINFPVIPQMLNIGTGHSNSEINVNFNPTVGSGIEIFPTVAGNAGAALNFLNNAAGQIATIGYNAAQTGMVMAGNWNYSATTASTSTTTGALTVAGGVGIGGSLFTGGDIQTSRSATPTTGAIFFGTPNTNFVFYDGAKFLFSSSPVSIPATVASTSMTTGALQVAGGVGIGGDINLGGRAAIGGALIPGAGFNARHQVFFDAGALTGLTVIGTTAGVGGFMMGFCNNNGAVNLGWINITGAAPGTGVAYTTASDGRLKEDLRDFTIAGEILDRLKIWDFRWKSTGERGVGVIAQEAVEVFPDAISHIKDAEGDIVWGVDYSKFVPLLLDEVQSLRTRVATLEAKMEALLVLAAKIEAL